jgi:hypothetical protein
MIRPVKPELPASSKQNDVAACQQLRSRTQLECEAIILHSLQPPGEPNPIAQASEPAEDEADRTNNWKNWPQSPSPNQPKYARRPFNQSRTAVDGQFLYILHKRGGEVK